MTFSTTLDKNCRLLTGLKLLSTGGRVVFLIKGITTAVFQFEGNCPDPTIVLIIVVGLIGVESTSTQYSTTFVGTGSVLHDADDILVKLPLVKKVSSILYERQVYPY